MNDQKKTKTLPKWWVFILYIVLSIIFGFIFSILIPGCSEKSTSTTSLSSFGDIHNDIAGVINNASSGKRTIQNPMGSTWPELRNGLRHYFIEHELSEFQADSILAEYDYKLEELSIIRNGQWIPPKQNTLDIAFERVIADKNLSSRERDMYRELYDIYQTRDVKKYNERFREFAERLSLFNSREFKSIYVFIDVYNHSSAMTDSTEYVIRDISLGTWGATFDALVAVGTLLGGGGSSAAHVIGGAGLAGLASSWYKEYLKATLPWHFH